MLSKLGRRHFLSLAGAAAVASPALARSRDYVDLRDAIGSKKGPHTKLIADAFSEARRNRVKVVARAGTYLLDDDLTIDWDNFALEGEGDKTRFVQTKPMRGFLQLTGDGAVVRGVRLACDFDRQPIRGVWRGYNAFQRVCAAWVEGSRNLLEAVSGENTFGVVCLRGPVVPLQGRESGSRNFNYMPRSTGNKLIDVSGEGTDFVLTGNQQEDLLIDGLTARDTTSKSVPPHAIYMQNPGSTSAFCGYSLRVTAKRLDSVGNPYSDAFKFSDIRDLTIEGAKSRDTVGGLMVSTSDGVTVTDSDWQYRGRGRARTAVRITQTTRLRVVGGRSSGPGGGILAYHGSEAVEVEGFRIADDYPPGGHNAPFRVLDSSEAKFTRCRREREGADRAMFVVADKGVATIESPESRNSAWIVHCGPEATVNLQVDPGLIDNWSPVRGSLSGSIERITRVAPGTEKQRSIISRPLPGAPDNACP